MHLQHLPTPTTETSGKSYPRTLSDEQKNPGNEAKPEIPTLINQKIPDI